MKNFFRQGYKFANAVPGDEAPICQQLSLAFGFDGRRAAEYLSHVGLASFRTVRDRSGALSACSALLMTSHHIGGRDVPAANIAHVAIAPEARGQGLARPIVDALSEDARNQGALMVSLFASARPVYRKCGFELAGSEIVYEAETAALPVRTAIDFFQLQSGDPRLPQAYAKKKRNEAGLIGRADVHWKELFRQPADALAVYGAGDPDNLQAYVIVDASNSDMLEIRDWHADDGAMAEALLSFIGRFRSVYPKARWHGGPQDELVAAMPDKGWRLAHQEEWLARILDPVAALESRGYRETNASFNLRIADTAGDADLHLDLRKGAMRVSAAAKDGLPLVSVTGAFFASLFTGFSPASRLMRRGRLLGSPETVQLCDRVFAGPSPWVAEHF